jgi:hypothetical protein
MTFNNHLNIGFTRIVHKNREITTTLNNLDFETFLQEMDNFDFDVGYVPAGFEHRADLISDTFYNTPTLDWLILWFNKIKDPFQELNVRDQIKIPRVI